MPFGLFKKIFELRKENENKEAQAKQYLSALSRIKSSFFDSNLFSALQTS